MAGAARFADLCGGMNMGWAGSGGGGGDAQVSSSQEVVLTTRAALASETAGVLSTSFRVRDSIASAGSSSKRL